MEIKKANFKVFTSNSSVNIDESDIDNCSIIEFGDNGFNVLYENRMVNCNVENFDFQNKSCKIEIENEIFEIKINSPLEQKLELLGFKNESINKITEIKSPMPGLVLDILVKNGDEVEEGDILIILEAMKMENVIKCGFKSKISEILVEKGQPVNKGQNLIKFI